MKRMTSLHMLANGTNVLFLEEWYICVLTTEWLHFCLGSGLESKL